MDRDEMVAGPHPDEAVRDRHDFQDRADDHTPAVDLPNSARAYAAATERRFFLSSPARKGGDAPTTASNCDGHVHSVRRVAGSADLVPAAAQPGQTPTGAAA